MKNNKIFRIVFFIFLLIVILLLVDMARQTTPPWKKKKTTDPVAQNSLHHSVNKTNEYNGSPLQLTAEG